VDKFDLTPTRKKNMDKNQILKDAEKMYPSVLDENDFKLLANEFEIGVDISITDKQLGDVNSLTKRVVNPETSVVYYSSEPYIIINNNECIWC